MLFQLFVFIVLGVLIATGRRARRMSQGGSAFFALSATASSVVLASTYLTTAPSSELLATLASSTAIICTSVLMPLLFWNTKHFTNLSLPQWRSIRAFAIGVPLLLGIDAAVRSLSGAGSAGHTDSYIWVSYVFAISSVLACAWRFSSTPRQRRSMLMMMLPPSAIASADVAHRFFDVSLWGVSPAIFAIAATLLLMSFAMTSRRSFAVRPVARSALVDQVQDGLLVVDKALRIVDYNDAASRWLSSDDLSLIGRNASAHLPTELLLSLRDGSQEPLTLPWWSQNREHWFEIQFKPLIVDNKNSGHLITLRDISRRRRAEMALQRSRDELQAANERLEALANTDPLTGLYNRRFLQARLAAEMDRHNRSKMTLGVLLLDLDHFKQVNDRFGHPVGDAVLIAAAQCMQDTARDCDLVARFGGEEFAILVVDAQPNGPQILAKRLCKAISEMSVISDLGEPVPVTTSIGCVNYAGGRVNGDTLIKLADQALYAAKTNGRNRVELAQYAPLPAASHNRVEPTATTEPEPFLSN